MASEYDMLSFVGSDIDEVKMDHLTFFKIYHTVSSKDEEFVINSNLATDL